MTDECFIESFPLGSVESLFEGARSRSTDHSIATVVAVTCSGVSHSVFEEPAMEIKPLFTATATATGGRNGHTQASDGTVSVDLSVPKEMGGPGKPGTATPEHLFAAGYAACFGGAVDYVAAQKKKNAKGAKITCSVTIGPRALGGFGLAVKLLVVDPSLPQSELEALAREAHEHICPYSHATRGNVDVALEVKGA
jgi:lipoyl-dependent peroxiredoxin